MNVKLKDAAALILAGWALMLPAAVPQPGDAEAAPSPSVSVWNSYPSRSACEQDRQTLLDDPVIGSRMKLATCVPEGNNDTPSKTK
jgi:hypothetical protein